VIFVTTMSSFSWSSMVELCVVDSVSECVEALVDTEVCSPHVDVLDCTDDLGLPFIISLDRVLSCELVEV
jgi:hypothetical protein